MPDLLDIIHREWPVIRGAPYSFFISIVAVAAILWTIFELRYRRRLEQQPKEAGRDASASVTGSGNSSVTGGNATAKVDIYAYPPIPVVATAQEEEPGKHNIQLIRPKSVFVEPAIEGNGLYEREHRTNFRAFVACLRNEPATDKHFVDANGVTANVLYFDSSKEEIGEGIAGLCWLNDSSNTVNFAVGGKTHNVILALWDLKEKRFIIPFLRRITLRRRYTGLVQDGWLLPKEPSQITLRLIGGDGQLLLPPLNFDLTRSGEDWDLIKQPS
ncbi:MAG: hypothetical protein WAM13_03125 [Candidatus Sulfotelmatobacter sp.]